MTKIRFYDVLRQTRKTGAICSVDAENCYDRVAHAIVSLIFQSYGIPLTAAKTMLTAIQEMKFYLRTAFGDSKDFAGATLEIKTQGLCQGNGAAPAGWAVVSITILSAHKRKGHGAKLVFPLFNTRAGTLSAVLYVDDSDVIHLNMTEDEEVEVTHESLQESVWNWGQLLQATGGALKGSKCFFHLISFGFQADGTWYYEPNEENEQFKIGIPAKDGQAELIEHCGVEVAHKTLGVMTCPSGCNAAAITKMKDAAEGWTATAREAKLSRRNFWLMADRQLKPKMFFGLGTNTANLETLETCLLPQYYNLLPLGGIRRSVRRGIRQTDMGFYGAGCPHPGVECLVKQVSCLLTHYGCATAVGRMLGISMQLFALELGMGAQPFQVDFSRYGTLVTDSWLKSLWEKTHRFGISVSVALGDILPPRENDKWIMTAFVDNGHSIAELERLNRVRMHQQVLFVSDVFDSSGRVLEKRYLTRRLGPERWSTYLFPRQSPPPKDFKLWRNALQTIRSHRVGRLLHNGHRIWDWRYVESEQIVLHRTGDTTMDVYTATGVPRYAGRPNCWTRSRIDQVWRERGEICSVTEIARAVWRTAAPAARPAAPSKPGTIKEQLAIWGHEWIWRDLHISGEGLWLYDAIKRGKCIAASDGSFMREAHPHLCSTAFTIECTDGTGVISGSFAEFSAVASAYRGELLGLMAVHLILHALREVTGRLSGKIRVYSDCKGALSKIRWLPTARIPARCRHADILKVLLQTRDAIGEVCVYKHVRAHQDVIVGFYVLGRPAQLNCLMDAKAKRSLLEALTSGSELKRQFPTEAIACHVGMRKVTSEAAGDIHFWAHRRLARESLCTPTKRASSILTSTQFDEVAWEFVAMALKEVPRMFQLWACKQVWDIAGTNLLRSKWDKTVSSRCPSCRRWKETGAHILQCREKGRVEFWHAAVDLLEQWLRDTGTDPIIHQGLVEYARGRGGKTLSEIVRSIGAAGRHCMMAEAQDRIGWRRTMEGMISRELVICQDAHSSSVEKGMDTGRWAKELP